MKFRQQQKYAIHLRWLLRRYVNIDGFTALHDVIPVPLHSHRLKERGYNQTEAIFKSWAREEKLSWSPNCLQRIRSTTPQWQLNRSQRKENMKEAFAIYEPEIVRNRHIILVDDIVTTGITLDECSKVLKQAGAMSVQALVIASGAP